MSYVLVQIFFIFIIISSKTETIDGSPTTNDSRSSNESPLRHHIMVGGNDFNLEALPVSYPIIIIYMEEETLLEFNYSITTGNSSLSPDMFTNVCVSVDNDDKVEILNETDISIKAEGGNFLLLMKGKLPGRANLIFMFGETTNEISFKVYIELKERTVDVIFTSIVITLVVLANIGMGAKVDLEVVKKELKKPIAPIIGMCSQFIFMPLIAFALAYNLTLDPGVALGFFALGCSPGGSASNIYTYLLKGNISLSVTMTLISSIASLGFLPLWLFTVGPLIYDERDIKIPFSNIILSMLGILAPIGIGLLLQRKFPKVAEFFIKAVKYIMVIFFIFVFTVGIYANWFIFLLISWQVIIATACLPYLGFIIGGVFALITRQSKANVIAIALETGIQNTGIPIILLRLSLSGPEKTTSIVAPVMSAIFTPIPIMFAVAYVQIKAWQKRRQKERENDLDLDDIDTLKEIGND